MVEAHTSCDVRKVHGLGAIAAASWPGYDPIAQSISSLVHAPLGVLQTIAFASGIPLTLGWAIGAGRTIGATAGARRTVRLVFLLQAAISAAYRTMAGRLGTTMTGAVVQQMVTGGVELLVGAVVDPAAVSALRTAGIPLPEIKPRGWNEFVPARGFQAEFVAAMAFPHATAETPNLATVVTLPPRIESAGGDASREGRRRRRSS